MEPIEGWLSPRVAAALVAAAISVIGVLVSLYFQLQTRSLAKTNTAIAEFNATQAYHKHLLEWAGQCQDVLSKAYVHSLPTQIHRLNSTVATDILIELTTLIDRGRWLLPNKDHDRFGTNKEAAYSGFRQVPLDCLVAAYDLVLESMQKIQNRAKEHSGTTARIDVISRDEGKTLSQKLWHLKREFTSAIQEKLEPRAMEAHLQRLRAQK
jgi:hypothetical protein